MLQPHRKLKIDIKQDTFEEKVLKFLKETGYLILDASFPRKYYAYTGLWRRLFGLDFNKYHCYQKEFKQKFLSALQRLENKGLVTKTKYKAKRCWLLNNQGEVAINQLDDFKFELPPEDNKLRIFIFDIPEKYRKSRDEIRLNLVSFGYRMLQKSVWIGKRPLPIEFFEDIKEKGLWQDVHFFEIKERGTINNSL